MDLPTCPDCGQSVLDDEAVDCPFCGASMSGKSGAKSKSGATVAAATKPDTRKKTPAKPGAAKSSATSDDPFDVSAPVSRTAFQLLPKPVKGKLHRVICPMCESSGFSSKKVAGKEVRCANKDCLVPVFTAPADEEDTPETVAAVATEHSSDEKKGGLSIGMYVVIGVVAAALIGGVGWVTVGPGFGGGVDVSDADKPYVPPARTPGSTPGTGSTDAALATTTKTPATVETPGPGSKTPAEPVKPAGPTVDQLTQSAIAQMLDAAQTRDGNNQQAFCIAQVAEAYAFLGDVGKSREQIDVLRRVFSNQKQYGVLPLIELAWLQLKQGDAAAAAAAASEALELASSLPGSGLLTLESLTELAAVLVTLDRADEAEALFRDRESVPETAEFAGLIARGHRVSAEAIPAVVGLRSVVGSKSPSRAAVAFILTSRGQAERGLDWARTSNSPDVLVDALCGWAEASVLTSGASAMASVEAGVASLAPLEKAKVLARCAVMLHGRGDTAAAQGVIAQAKQASGSVQPPAAMAMPDLKTETQLKLPDEDVLARSARALAEVAFAEAKTGSADAAWATIQAADAWTRAMAPSPLLARVPLQEIDQRGQAAVTGALKAALNLLTDDDARTAYLQYRNRILQLVEVSKRRFALQEAILNSAASWGLSEQVWNTVNERISNTAEPAIGEPWLETRLPSTLYWRFKSARRDELASAVETALTPAGLKNPELTDERSQTQLAAEESLSGSEFLKGQVALTRYSQSHRSEPDTRWQQTQYLALTMQLVSSGRPTEALQFAARIPDPATKEIALELTGRAVTTSDRLGTVPGFLEKNPLPPADLVAVLRGALQAAVSLSNGG